MNRKSLADLREGDKAYVTGLLSQGNMKRRLQDLGVVVGTWIRCVQKSPFGDPVAYEIRGAIIALRHEDAGNIIIA